SCIRECPASAIRVEGGQAVVVTERCISCGHCVKVCSQHAKMILSDSEYVVQKLLPSGKAFAIVAPSFAAAFPDNYFKFITGLKILGFDKVAETAFGADLVSIEYNKIFESKGDKTIISSSCPAVYNFIEKYYSNLIPMLAPVVSPMIAMGKYLKENYGTDIPVVFIGPCVAKKSEYDDWGVEGAIDAVLTFHEVKELFSKNEVVLETLDNSNFDPPYANLGKSYPLAGGLIKTANIPSDILTKEIIVVEGKDKVVQVINDIAEERIKSKFVDILFCEGCINGPAIDNDLNYYSKREKVIEYVERHINFLDKNVWKGEIYNSRNIDLSRKFFDKNQRRPMPNEEKIKEILARTNKFTKTDELNCGACGYKSCREYAIAIAKDLAEQEMCLPYLIDKLEKAYTELKDTQDALAGAEKLASIGQLAAGVAHEINNPLGSIMLYASMLKREFEKKMDDLQGVEDLKLIIEEAVRCKNIVANLLNFARQGKLNVSTMHISELINDATKVLMIRPENAEIDFSLTDNSNDIELEGDIDQLKQVFINVIGNACEAMEESKIKKLSITISNSDKEINIKIIDSGCGVPEDNIKKLFTPFFTTKKMGKGTGLGLAITYGIIKMHRGDIKVKSTVNIGTEFTIKLPLKVTKLNNYE
ncbi:MAG TPA: [Fe-Fe] hydrogenase large subunit C-terminal domain-containing protein, partial [Melioribacteraceae bacterium]|nr:[Fe-Fe] hydrogenase large subunit C-terminal domain-containing protein [Melioribacteraceae bacterium]